MMTEKELAILNCNEYFRQHLKSFIEGFVLFYGEKYRDEIKEKFENALLIWLSRY